MLAVDALEERERREECIPLPPLIGQRLRQTAKRFRGATGVGGDWLRPRHVALLSDQAADALATLLTAIEHIRRWPEVIRSFVEVALGKKSGGSRLIGLGAAPYRIWARTRYLDVKAALEPRLKRPFLSAALGRGAARAAFDTTWAVEQAAAKQQSAATTSADLTQFYEHVRVVEFAHGACSFGVPMRIIALAAHAYTGHRRIRVGRAISRKIYPRLSIVAGCTWATVWVRVYVIEPVEGFLKAVHEVVGMYEVTFMLVIYIDDAILTSIGDVHGVATVHTWASAALLHWLAHVLRKPVATSKLQCTASPANLRAILKPQLALLDIPVFAEGEVLGTDYAAGGKILRRAKQVHRRRQACSRMGRVKWWRGLGGQALSIVQCGLRPSTAYGCGTTGIPPSTMRDLRRSQGAVTGSSCGGSSLTSKLAIGGNEWREADPAVLDANWPLIDVASKLWDDPSSRQGFVFAWRQATRDMVGEWSGRLGAGFVGLLGRRWSGYFSSKPLGQSLSRLRYCMLALTSWTFPRCKFWRSFGLIPDSFMTSGCWIAWAANMVGMPPQCKRFTSTALIGLCCAARYGGRKGSWTRSKNAPSA